MKLFLISLCAAVCTAARLDNTYLPPGNANTAGGNSNFLSAPVAGFSGSGFAQKQSGFGYNSGTGFSGTSNFGNKFGTGSGFGRTSGFNGYSGAVNRPYTPVPIVPPTTYGAPAGQYNYRSGLGYSGPQIPILRSNNDNYGDGNYRYEYETANGIQAQEAGQLKNVGTQNEANDVRGSYAYIGDDGVQYSVSYIADENGFRPIGAHLPTPPPIPEAILKSLQQNAAEEAAGKNQYYDRSSETGQYHSGTGYHGYNSYNHNGAADQYQYNRGSAGFNSFGNSASSRQYLAPRKQSFNPNTGYNY